VKRVVSLLALVYAAVLFWLYIWPHIYDPRMGAGAAGRALSERVHNGGVYVCHRMEKDISLSFMHDVDYACNAQNKPAVSGYWIGTDRDSITEIEPNG
jgi:hypothetical protein